jgi:2-oxoglutarate ferredoxin oxidoreductase subunit beta
MGSLETPFNPVSLALGAEASFVARTIDSDRRHLTDVLRAAAQHPGSALVEIYQNCNIFNDGAFEAMKDKDQAQDAVIRLEHGERIRFGTTWTEAEGGDGAGRKGVARNMETGDLEIVDIPAEGLSRVLVHNERAASPTNAFALSRLADNDTLHQTPIGILRNIERPVYEERMAEQLEEAVQRHGKGDLGALLTGNDTWTVAG